jgi:acyl-coenzyme A thioesterase PaaI-like protein
MHNMQNRVEKAIQDYYPDDSAQCYGCGRLNKDGHYFRTGWREDKTLTVYTPREEHTAVPGFVYGGVIASLLDCHGSGSCALALFRKNGHELGDDVKPTQFVAASLQVNFLKPTPHGKPLKVIGTVTEIHPKRFKVNSELFVDEHLCVTSEFEGVVMPKDFLVQKDSSPPLSP